MKLVLISLILVLPPKIMAVVKSVVNPADISINGALMEGYYVRPQKFTGSNCLSGNIMNNIEKKATIYFDSSIVYNELCNILNGGFAIARGTSAPGIGPFNSSCFNDPFGGLYSPFERGGYDSYEYNGDDGYGDYEDPGIEIGDGSGYSVSASAKFLNFSKETSTAFVLTFGYKLELGNQYLSDARISKEYLEMMENPNRFAAVCGEHYIYNIKRGAYAFVTVKVETGSKLRKNEIGSTMNLNLGLISLAAGLKNLKQKYGASIKIDIRGLQRGGDANMLSEVIGDGQLCSDHDNYGCKDIITAIHRYFSETLPVQFNLIDFGAEGLGSKSVATSYSTRTYCSASGKVPNSCSWPLLDRELDGIENSLNNFKSELKKANQALSTLMLSKKKMIKLSKYRMEMMYNIALIEKTSEECMQDHARCKNILAKAKSFLRPEVKEIFEGLPTTKLEHQVAFCFKTDKPKMEYVDIKFYSRLDKNLGTYRISNFENFDFESNGKICFKRVLDQQIKELEKLKFEVKGLIVDRKGNAVDVSNKCGIGKKKVRSMISWEFQELEILREGKRPLKIDGHKFYQKNKCQKERAMDTWELNNITFMEL